MEFKGCEIERSGPIGEEKLLPARLKAGIEYVVEP
jgi:hypothetical protein